MSENFERIIGKLNQTYEKIKYDIAVPKIESETAVQSLKEYIERILDGINDGSNNYKDLLKEKLGLSHAEWVMLENLIQAAREGGLNTFTEFSTQKVPLTTLTYFGCQTAENPQKQPAQTIKFIIQAVFRHDLKRCFGLGLAAFDIKSPDCPTLLDLDMMTFPEKLTPQNKAVLLPPISESYDTTISVYNSSNGEHSFRVASIQRTKGEKLTTNRTFTYIGEFAIYNQELDFQELVHLYACNNKRTVKGSKVPIEKSRVTSLNLQTQT